MSREEAVPSSTPTQAGWSRRPGRRKEILNVFVRNVAERGFERTNFGDIAAELGISKGTIVHHFGTKNVLMRELQEDYMRRRRDEADTIVQAASSADEKLAALLCAFVYYQAIDRTTTIAFQREMVQLLDDPVLANVRKQRAEYRGVVRDVIREGIENELFRQCDADIVSLHIFGSVHWMWTWFDPHGRASIDDVAAEYVRNILGGLLVHRDNLQRLSDPQGDVFALVCRTLDTCEAQP